MKWLNCTAKICLLPSSDTKQLSWYGDFGTVVFDFRPRLFELILPSAFEFSERFVEAEMMDESLSDSKSLAGCAVVVVGMFSGICGNSDSIFIIF